MYIFCIFIHPIVYTLINRDSIVPIMRYRAAYKPYNGLYTLALYTALPLAIRLYMSRYSACYNVWHFIQKNNKKDKIILLFH